jgi:LmbE family N-acetylglucosaminyl deacetylase
VEFLDHRDGVIEEGVALRRDLAAAIRRYRPELLVTLNHREHFGDRAAMNSPDHRAVGRGVLDAAGDAGNRWIFTEQLGEGGLEPWDGVRWVAVAASPEATHAQAVGEDSVERAVSSLLAHRAYLEGLGVEPAGGEDALDDGEFDNLLRALEQLDRDVVSGAFGPRQLGLTWTCRSRPRHSSAERARSLTSSNRSL